MMFLFKMLKERRLLEGQNYGRFEEESIESAKTYGTMGADPQLSVGVDNPAFQESSFTTAEYQVR